jgi:hypothetical protein
MADVSKSERIIGTMYTVVEGLSAGRGTVGLAVDGRRFAAGREPMETLLPFESTQHAWRMMNQQTQAVFGRRYLPASPSWKVGLALNALGFGTMFTVKRLEAAQAFRTALTIRYAARAVTALCVASLAISFLLAVVSQQWLFLGCFVAGAAIATASEKGWIAARYNTYVQWAMTALAMAWAALSGSYITLALILAFSAFDVRSRRSAQQAAATAPPAFSGMEKEAVRAEIMNALRNGLVAYDPASPQGAQSRPMADCRVDRAAARMNYHGLSLQPGTRVEPQRWSSFVWPAWLTQDSSQEWTERMRSALLRHTPEDQSLRTASSQQLWQQMHQRLTRGITQIANRQSNGGAIEDWAPVQAAVQELLNQVESAQTAAHRQRVRTALCGVVGRLMACGAGVETALVEAVRDDLQGGASSASFLLRAAALFRREIVHETYRGRLAALQSFQHGQESAHSAMQVAMTLPELNLPDLPAALRDPSVFVPLGFASLLKWYIPSNRLWDPQLLLDAVTAQLSAAPEVMAQWVQQRLPDGALRQEVLGALGYLPIADEDECPAQMRMSFYQGIARAMLLDVGLLLPC